MKLSFSCLPLLLGNLMSAASPITINFDQQPLGPPGKDWIVAMTHEGGAPQWEILAGETPSPKGRMLAQTSTDKTSGRFPLAVYAGASLTDGSVSVRFKPVSGERDQAAGIVWRYQNPDNYYIVRANALENNVVLYKVENGTRISLAPKGTPSKTYGVKQTVPKQAWSILKVEFQGPRFTVYFDGAKIMEVEDSTFGQAGRTGLWTKADSVTYFDDFQVETRR